jgi:hypothetical protein
MGPIVTQHRLAFTLHIILIAIHVVLVIVWSKHYERGFTLNQDSETLATLQHQALTVLIPQTFAIVSASSFSGHLARRQCTPLDLSRCHPYSFAALSAIACKRQIPDVNVPPRSGLGMERIWRSIIGNSRSISASHRVSPDHLHRYILGSIHNTSHFDTCPLLSRRFSVR